MCSVKEICNYLNLKTELADKSISKICCQANQIVPDCAYFCIKGETFDSYNVRTSILRKNSVTVFTDKPIQGINCVYIENPHEGYVELARLSRNNYCVHSVAVTGSIGKTSQKEMLYATLSAAAKTLRTSGSSNSKLAGANTILNFNEDTVFAVYEMGLRRPNNTFRSYSELVQPELCVITNIGNSHIENFRDQNHILDEKLYITSGMSPDGVLVINGDDKTLTGRTYPFHTITFAINNQKADYVAEDILVNNDSIVFNAVYDKGSIPIRLNVPGRHNIFNALACVAVGKHFGLTDEQITTGLGRFTTSGYRQNVLTGYRNNTIILDCLNATPESMESGLEMLKDLQIDEGARKIAILGHMMRLGRLSEKLHREVGQKLAEYDFDIVVTYSGHSEYITEELKSRGKNAHHFYSKQDVIEFLEKSVQPHDALLFKGVDKFCKFADIYYGLTRNLELPPYSYYGPLADDFSLHTDAKAFAVVDCTTRTILAGKNIEEKLEVASLAMIVSALTAIENRSMDETVTISPISVKGGRNGSNIKLVAGQQYRLSDLLKASMLRSAFDAMTAVAEHVGKNIDTFVEMMNQVALKAGAVNTFFTNPTGRPDARGYSTARDMAMIVSYAVSNRIFQQLMSLTSCSITELVSGRETETTTTLPLLKHESKPVYLDYYCDCAIGIKAGKNAHSKQCVASCAKTAEGYIAAIILGADDYEYNRFSFLDTARILRSSQKSLDPPSPASSSVYI